MGCGCGGGRKSSSRRSALRPSTGVRSVKGGPAAGPTPTQLRLLNMQKTVELSKQERMDQQRLHIEKLRRAIIKRRQGG